MTEKNDHHLDPMEAHAGGLDHELDNLGLGDDGEFDSMPSFGGASQPRHEAHDDAHGMPEPDHEHGEGHDGADHAQFSVEDEHADGGAATAPGKSRLSRLMLPVGGSILALAAAFFVVKPLLPGSTDSAPSIQAGSPQMTVNSGPRLPPARMQPAGDIKPPFPPMHAMVGPAGPSLDPATTARGPSSDAPLAPVPEQQPPASQENAVVDALKALTAQLKTVGEKVQATNESVDQTRQALSAREDQTDEHINAVGGKVGDMERKLGEYEHRLALLESGRQAGSKASSVTATGTAPRPGHTGHARHAASVSYAGREAAVPPAATVQGFVLRGVSHSGDEVLVETPSHEFKEAALGKLIPGVGKVLDIRHEGNRWVVVTSAGTIYP